MNWGKDRSVFSEIVSISIIVSPYLRLCCLPLRFISHCLWEAPKSNESFKSVKNSYNAVGFRRYPSSLQNLRQIPQKKTVCHISNFLDVSDKFQYCSNVDGDKPALPHHTLPPLPIPILENKNEICCAFRCLSRFAMLFEEFRGWIPTPTRYGNWRFQQF